MGKRRKRNNKRRSRESRLQGREREALLEKLIKDQSADMAHGARMYYRNGVKQ